DPFYAIRRADPETLAADIDTFQLVEGNVVDAADVRGVIYLNFGANWRTDFTVRIDRKAARLFKRAGLGPETYRGRHLRVRGWLKNWNGPMIEATHPEQIEVLAK
ncbi:MAG: thermonuclease family protein, partial [Alphaproteobacteria bacterium]